MGCRGKAAKATLLRVVAAGDRSAPRLAPDPAGRLPGRGACVHPDLRCVDLADKRRAFPRALRLSGPLDLGPVREHVLGTGAAGEPDSTTGTSSTTPGTTPTDDQSGPPR